MSWTKLGLDIDGENPGDQSGSSVSMNQDGTRVAIGAYYNDGNDGNDNVSGHVRVYQYNGSAWAQMGGDIDGKDIADQSGWSVSLSANGERVAIGAMSNGTNSGDVRVYEYIADASDNNKMKWMQMGTDIDGEVAYARMSVSLSPNGERVAIGAYLNDGNTGNPIDNRGHVRVYEYIADASDNNKMKWMQMGTDIDGEAAGDWSGYSLSLSANGERVAIGAYRNDGPNALTNTNDNRGHVRVYNWNGSAWAQMGVVNELPQDIDGENAGDESGWSVSLSALGTRVAIGAPKNDGTSGTDRGRVRVYEYNGTYWAQMGDDIAGENPGDWSGWSVSISADGTRVAIGALLNDGNTDNPLHQCGHVRVYEYNGAAWVQLGADIDGEAGADHIGYSVSLSANGRRVAIGVFGIFGDNSINKGKVRVYQLAATVEVNLAIAVNASGTINIFGEALPEVQNVIIAQTKLPASALYTATNSMFEFWEPSADPDTRLADLATTEGRNWKLLTDSLEKGIQACLEGDFNVGAASPFNDNKYSGMYNSVLNFGDLAYRSYLHYILGHVDATFAISNDTAFKRAMLSHAAPSPPGAPSVYTYAATEVADYSIATITGSNADAQLARLLVKAIASKNGADVLAIANQVIGQDASRASGEDNNEITDPKRQALKFIAGDVIYMNIQLQPPNIVLGTAQQVSKPELEGRFTGENYTLKITLS